jgi:hypothetical protein
MTAKSLRGFVDQTEARLAPGSVQQFSGVVYRWSGDELYINY